VKVIGEMLVRAADLLEAEGRLLRHNVVRTAAIVGVVLAIVLMTLGGLALLAAALFVALSQAMGTAGAAAITGGLLLLLAAMVGLFTPWLIR
jgi:Ni,Fe-hydrogenase I cytochrome b subunit